MHNNSNPKDKISTKVWWGFPLQDLMQCSHGIRRTMANDPFCINLYDFF